MTTQQIKTFKRYVKEGKSPEIIMKKMAISRRTYYNFLKEAQQNRRKKEIDRELYFKLIMRGYTTKDNLAADLGVTKPTLIKHEKDGQITLRLCRMMHVLGYSQLPLHALHITKAKAREYTNGVATLRGVENSLKSVIETISNTAEFAPDSHRQINMLKKALVLIGQCRELSNFHEQN